MSSTISAQNAEYMKHLGEKARKAATILAKTPAQVKNNTLNTLADLLLKC